MIKKSRADIQKAFKVLEEAIESKEAEIKDSFRGQTVFNNVVANSMEAVNTSVGQLESIFTGGEAFIKLAALRAENELKQNPQLFIGKVAMGCFGLGLILGSRFRKSRSRAKK